MKDHNICEHCNLYFDLDVILCSQCQQPLVLDAHDKISIWRLDTIPDGILGPVMQGLRETFGRDVVLQPAFMDERLSVQPAGWKGLNANKLLDQVDRRHRKGMFLSLGFTRHNISPGVKYNFIFGYGYEGWRSGLVSLHMLKHADPILWIERTLKIALHEAGHGLGLDHHAYEEKIQCTMQGDEEQDSVKSVDAGPSGFCAACERKLRRKGALAA